MKESVVWKVITQLNFFNFFPSRDNISFADDSLNGKVSQLKALTVTGKWNSLKHAFLNWSPFNWDIWCNHPATLSALKPWSRHLVPILSLYFSALCHFTTIPWISSGVIDFFLPLFRSCHQWGWLIISFPSPGGRNKLKTSKINRERWRKTLGFPPSLFTSAQQTVHLGNPPRNCCGLLVVHNLTHWWSHFTFTLCLL